VGRIARNDITGYVRDRYRPDRVLIAATGRIEHDALVVMCRERFEPLKGSCERPADDRPDFNPGVFICSRDLEQVHIVV
jgi:predicted Zn-dependent peptidase